MNNRKNLSYPSSEKALTYKFSGCMKIFITQLTIVHEMLEVDNPNVEKDTQLAQDIEIFKIVTEHFRQDIREFWTRANFYLLAHAGLFSAFVVAYPTLIREQNIIVISIPIIGLIIAIFWFITLRGAIHWIQQWRAQVKRLSKELDRFKCYFEVESAVGKSHLLSPSYVTQFLPLVFAITWLAILLLVFVECIPY